MGKWRAMSDEELAELRMSLADRRGRDSQARDAFATPDAAQRSFAGALYWALASLWQDHPVALTGGLSILIWHLAQVLLAVMHR